MNVYIHHIETRVPEHAYPQDYVCEQMIPWTDDPRVARLVRQVFRRSGIARRHSVLPDFLPGQEPQLYLRGADGKIQEPSTEARNRCYIKSADSMSVELARRTLAESGGFKPAAITHLITASCTGFYNPGADYRVIRELGLSPATQRYHLGFMGCYAAFPALRMAQQFCQAQPDAVVLIICLELCSLHMQVRLDPDTVLANALFADGAAAALVSAHPPLQDRPVLRIDGFACTLAPEGRGDMTWDIGNTGFNLVLSSYVPDIIGANIGAIVDDLLIRAGRSRADVALWAVHPGGKAILDTVERALALRPEQLDASRQTLHDYGNLSSATTLFVLRRLLDTHPHQTASVCAMAFGPGLVIETALLQLQRRATPSPADGFKRR